MLVVCLGDCGFGMDGLEQPGTGAGAGINMELLTPALGLTERRPVPDPVSFSGADPLGTSTVAAADNNNVDIAASISQYSSLIVELSCIQYCFRINIEKCNFP